MTSGEEPTLLKPGDTAWWFEEDGSNYHLFSVEKVFGMSRSIVELFARVSAFLNRYRRRSPSLSVIHGHPTPSNTRSTSPDISLALIREDPPPPTSPLAPLHAEASALFGEIENWRDYRTPAIHPRVEHGSEAHRCALLVLMMREAFNLPAHDRRVQQCAELTMNACYMASANFSMSVEWVVISFMPFTPDWGWFSLTWPVIIAGCQAFGPLRASVVSALEGFRWVKYYSYLFTSSDRRPFSKQCCFEIDTSEQIVTEVWRRMDSGHPRPDFRSVIADLNLRVLIL